MPSVRLRQYIPLEDVIRYVHAHEERCVDRYRRRRELGASNPCRCEGQEGHHEEMSEVDPYQSQRWRTRDEPHEVVVVDPNDGDEQVAHGIADDRGPQRDRKSTRLNSSHTVISYAVFCLKKKKKKKKKKKNNTLKIKSIYTTLRQKTER